jgi:N-acetylmuramic acid 6-phosphate etherase
MVDVRATNDKLRDRAARIISQLTGAGRAEALMLLDAAGGSAKAAVVMRSLDCSAAEADRALRAAGNRLAVALEQGPVR